MGTSRRVLRTFETLKEYCHNDLVNVLWKLMSSSLINAPLVKYPLEMAEQKMATRPHLMDFGQPVAFGLAHFKVRSSVLTIHGHAVCVPHA